MSLINLTANVAIAGGPSVAFNRNLEVEAYDSFDLTVKAGDVDLEVAVQPGGTVQLLVVTVDWQMLSDAPKGQLSFRLTNDAAATVFGLDEPMLLTGGALAALGSGQPKRLFLTNATAGATKKDAKVRILVGRNRQ